MTKRPFFSIIVPVYKAERTIHKCIDSILAQTFTDFELILVDDGSPDNSGAICELYAQKDKRIKVIHKENGGVSDARNVGLSNASGERICFVDSDDVVNDNFLEIFGQHNEDIVVLGMYRNDNPDKSSNKEFFARIEEGVFNLENVKKFMEATCKAENIGYLFTRAFKREIIEKANLRFDTRYKLREDLEFILRYLLECKSFATINKGTYHYDVPVDFEKKYSHIDPETNILCTLSIIENFEKIAEYPINLLAKEVNTLSRALIKMYKTKKIDKKAIKIYLKLFCTYYRRCLSKCHMSKKSHFIYYVIGNHTPYFLHKIYNCLLRKMYQKSNQTITK